MVSVLPSSDVVEQMLADGITNIFITNNDGVLTATVIGATPTVPMTLQVLCTESDISSDIAGLPSIVGSGIIQTVEADNLTDAVNILGEDVDDLKNAISELNRQLSDKADKTTYQTVTGTTLTLNPAVDNTMYLCGELTELTVTAPATGIFAVRFTSGTTPTVVTFTGITMPDDWPTTLDASTIYEINVLNGFGVWQSWI